MLELPVLRGLGRITLLFALWTFISTPSFAWGFFAHKEVNRLAVMTLPTDLIGFYKSHLAFISEHAVDPDKRRYAIASEAPRHFIDIDHYDKNQPFEVVPRRWSDAVEKYTEDTLKAFGTVPWHIQWVHRSLTEAFKERNLDRILQLSADLGHYLADAHVPLHTTENYNGQLTNQVGIHGFWESRLPELQAENYDFFVGKARYLESPLDATWEALKASHLALDSVLRFEAELSRNFPQDQKYTFEQAGARVNKVYSEKYANAYHDRLNGMVERRMRASILLVGSFWYSAWVNAGKPKLIELKEKEASEVLKKKIAEEEQHYKTGNLKGRDHED